MKKIITLLLFGFFATSLNAQMYSEPKKIEVKTEKPNKKSLTKDTANKPFLGAGFVFNATAALNRGLSTGAYRLKYGYDGIGYDYEMKNSFGYRLGIGIGFQGPKFGMELPIIYSVDRFKVPELSASNHLKISTVEFGLNQYFRFLKEKHYIMIGEYIATSTISLWDIIDLGDAQAIGLNLGYGYNITKRFNMSLRFKFNIFSITHYNGASVEIQKYYQLDYKGNSVDFINCYYNSLQLVARYDLVNNRKMKTKKKKEPKKPKDDYEYLNNQNTYTPPPTKPSVDYSGYSDSDLNLALKEANSKSDLDAMLGIQKEIDKRKQADEFSKYSSVQLEQELNKALDKEDYKRADMIKKEMAKRDTQKGMPSNNKPANSLESKSVEELTKLKNEAIQKEDYDKAKEIQDIINKKKP